MVETGSVRTHSGAAKSAMATGQQAQDAALTDGAVPYELIELFFFAYRDFVSDPDRILTELAFGRAHHRVLHFVDRNPGLTIAELLDILKITKQSLNRVLKELVEKEFIEVRTGHADRRQRHLHATQAGHSLATRLASVQGQRIHAALAGLAAPAQGAVDAYLTAMIDPQERKQVLARIRKEPVG